MAQEWELQEDNGVFYTLKERTENTDFSWLIWCWKEITAGVVGEITRNVIIPEFGRLLSRTQ
jgi:hypothetical protein